MITIRRLKNHEFDALAGLMDAYKRDIDEAPADAQAKERLREAVEKERIVFLVACEAEELVGMCSVCLTFSTYQCRPGGVFEDFYIIPRLRRTGLARRMADAAFAYARAQGAASLWVGASPSDERMYMSLGFETPLGRLLTWNEAE